MPLRARFFLLLSFCCLISAEAQISKGHQLLIDRGFQVAGNVSPSDPFHLTTFSNANYTTMFWMWTSVPSEMGPAPGFPWASWIGGQDQMPPRAGEGPYLSQAVMLQLGDEANLNDDNTRTQFVNWFNAVQNNWPNVVLFHNNFGGQVGDAQLYDFYSRAHPDMLCFDSYPFRIDGSGNVTDTLMNWYGDLRRYRQHAWGAGIPLGTYLQTFASFGEGCAAPSKSQLRVQHSAAMAFNCKALIDFTYNSGASALFTNSDGGDNSPNALYYEKADCALRARNFGKALVRLTPVPDVSFPDLRTTSMVFVRGRNSDGSLHGFPIGFYAGAGGGDVNTDWAYLRNDPYLTGWTVTNIGTKNNGYPGDVIISWFKPLDESFDGPNYTNEVYMMVVNGLSDPNGDGPDCKQQITLNFNSSLMAIEMMNPLTGLAEAKALPFTNGVRQLALNLNGGDAVLFKFSDGAPFLGTQLTGPPVISSFPANQTCLLNGSITFNARAAGAAPLSYQWQLNGNNIAGETGAAFGRTGLTFADAGIYTLVVSNSFGTASASTTLTIATSAPFFYEPFNYSNIGSPVSANTSANWTFGGSGTNDLMVAAGSLSYAPLQTSVGNSVTNGGVGLGVRRLFGTNLTSGVVYVSALFRINDLGYGTWNGGGTQVGALTAPDNTTFRLQFLVKSNSASGYSFGLQKGGTGSSAIYDTNEFHVGDTVLLVGSYDFTVTPNVVSLWINPDPSQLGASIPPKAVLTSSAGTDNITIDRFNIRQNTAASIPASIQWDELRVGNTWLDVTPPRPLPRFTSTTFQSGQIQLQAVGDSGNMTLQESSNLVNWIDVTTASGSLNYSENASNTPRFYRIKLAP
jgi:hypothetical protein